MKPEVRWLLQLCLDNKLLSQDQVKGMISGLPGTTSLHECAKLLVSSGWVKDTKFLENSIIVAVENVKKGLAPPNPEDAGNRKVTEQRHVMTKSPGFDKFQDFSIFNELDDEDLLEVTTDLFAQCKNLGASDLHITGGARLRIRHHRKIIYLSETPMDDALARRINLLLLTPEQRKQFETDLDLDYALTLINQKDGSPMRFRINLMEQKNGISGVYRIVNDQLMSLEELGFSKVDVIRRLLDYHNGIILVTGPVGSGKTTTLATLVNELNQKRSDHIITMEDPIEVIQTSAGSIITQREIGQHTASFHSALKSALREDPDIIVIGEMRDLTTIEMAITAAETGHLVIATMHTRDAKSTLNRILDVFPPSQQSQIRAMTAGSLRGIICQRQLPGIAGDVALASEILINTNAVANIIRDGKETGLEDAMQSGKRFGMQTMNDSVKSLLEAGKISPEVAAENTYHTE
jgi:twitching motility protein PilT